MSKNYWSIIYITILITFGVVVSVFGLMTVGWLISLISQKLNIYIPYFVYTFIYFLIIFEIILFITKVIKSEFEGEENEE